MNFTGTNFVKAGVAGGIAAGIDYAMNDGDEMMEQAAIAAATSLGTNVIMEGMQYHNNMAQAVVAGGVFVAIECGVKGTEECEKVQSFLKGVATQYIADVGVDGFMGGGYSLGSVVNIATPNTSIKSV